MLVVKQRKSKYKSCIMCDMICDMMRVTHQTRESHCYHGWKEKRNVRHAVFIGVARFFKIPPVDINPSRHLQKPIQHITPRHANACCRFM